MKKLFGKMITFALCAIVGLTCTACGQVGTTKDADNNTVQMYVWDSGYGIEWVQEIVNEYNAMNTGYTVDLKSHANMNTVTDTLSAGTSNVYDLYLTGLQSWTGTISDMADLSEVVNATYGNEGVTIGSKMSQAALQKHTVDGKLTALTLGSSASGLFYNVEIFEDAGITEAPITTDQFRDVVWDIQAAALKTEDNLTISPFVHWGDGNNGYWKYVYEVWTAQAMGIDAYEDFIQLKDTNGINQKNVYLGQNPDGTDNKENDPRYHVLSYLEEILNTNTAHSRVSEFQLSQAQSAFVNGESAMMINGSWLKNEAKMGNTVNNFKFMRTPIYSGVVKHLQYNNMSDDMLADIVSAIDDNKTFEQVKADVCADLVQADYDMLKTLRGMTYGTIGECGQIVFAPKYSSALPAVKDFLKYFYSDAGAQAWMDHQHTPFATRLIDETLVDKSNWDEWDKSIAEVLEDATYVLGGDLNSSKVLVRNAKDMFANVSIVNTFTAPLTTDRKSASQIYDQMRATINSNWDNWAKA